MTVSDIRRAASHCTFSCISGPATPGKAILAPPEKPLTRWGTIETIPRTRFVLGQELVGRDRRAVGERAEAVQA
ncbi:MAG: hypothetical protein IRY99_12580 [Isosphaeraceae bacterium]|nr:hypothetical protein [Isosphaeraceae bacterium]